MEPIFAAVLRGEREVARLLRNDPALSQIRAEADFLVKAIPHWLYVGDTSLHLAAAGIRLGVARVLLDSGAEPRARNRRGATPLHYACDPRPRSVGAWTPSEQAALIRLLVEHGAEIDRSDRGGATALHRAVRARSSAAVRQLLACGARTDCTLRKSGSSPLHLAVPPTGAGGTAGAWTEQLAIIDLLVEHGADPAAADAAGRRPGDWARNERVLKALQGGTAQGAGGHN